MPNNENANVICPYFMWMSKKSITCEGPVNDKFQMWFDTYKERIEWLRQYCEKYEYHECPVAKLNDQKYKE